MRSLEATRQPVELKGRQVPAAGQGVNLNYY